MSKPVTIELEDNYVKALNSPRIKERYGSPENACVFAVNRFLTERALIGVFENLEQTPYSEVENLYLRLAVILPEPTHSHTYLPPKKT